MEEKAKNTPQPEEDETKFWKMTKKELLKHFSQNEEGFTDSEVRLLHEKYGLNELTEPEGESIFDKIWEQFEDTLVRILLLAAVISFIIALTSGDEHEGLAAYVEPFVILLILIANAAIGVIQDINADKAIEALKKLQANECSVRRNGQLVKREGKELVPGDILILKEGDKVPADVRIIEIETSNFQINQANFTGETKPSYKTTDIIDEDEKPALKELTNIALSSTGVETGTCVGIVINTGMKTELGKIQLMVTESKDKESKSPLKEKLDEFGETLTKVIGIICIVVWVINYKNFFDDIHGSWVRGCIYYFKISVSLAVAAIPEGLPAVITTCLALGTKRMTENKAIIRKLDSIETLGCTTVICSDKTGTLTTNNMTFTTLLYFSKKGNELRRVSGVSFDPTGNIEDFNQTDFGNIEDLTKACSLNNNSTIEYDKKEKSHKIHGTATEAALRVFVEKAGNADPNFKKKASTSHDFPYPMEYNDYISSKYKVLFTLEFDRNRKAKSVLALDNKTKKVCLYTKGAFEIIVQNCSSILCEGGVETLASSRKQDIFSYVNENFANKALRTLGICKKEDLPSELQEPKNYNSHEFLKAYFKENQTIIDLEKNMTLLGVAGIKDPPRTEVKDAIQTCYGAGIRVIMITGDSKLTAEAIAKEIGLVKENGNLSNCSYQTSDFFKLQEKQRIEALRDNPSLIFSRSDPKHKIQIVEILKSMKHIVAMTGDGTNDAPALAEANIGVAMGISGTEVAKEASDMVLADDNFATIVKAISEGRSIYMNMKAFIRYLISSNIGEVVSIFLTSAFGLPEAFTSIQLLWVNLVTDGPPATALGFNPPEKNIMKKQPRSNDDPLLTNWVIIRYFLIGTYVGAATIGIFVYWYLYFEHTDGHTLVSWAQLTTWNQCHTWKDFAVNSFSGFDLSKDPCLYFTFAKKKPCTLSLTVLVVIEMFNAMNAISDESSLMTMPVWMNPWLIVAICFSMILHFVILYIPFMNVVFGIMPLDLNEWILVLVFSFPVVLLDEFFKIFVRLFRPKSKLVGEDDHNKLE